MSIPSHWIGGNQLSRQPNRFIWLDTEAHIDQGPRGQVQTWRIGVTCLDRREDSKSPWSEPLWTRHSEPEGLWHWVTAHCRNDVVTYLVAHNLAYDVRIAQALVILPRLGWVVTDWRAGDGTLALSLRHGKRRLKMIDSTGWFPTSIERIGALVSIPKPALPDEGDDVEAWYVRCEHDVAIMRRAMLDGLEWVKSADLGNWGATAGAMAWNVWRHRHMTDRVLVHDDVAARLAERSAAYTGRCEAWRWGPLPGGAWHEWDLPLAYPRVALDTPLPVKLLSHVAHPQWRSINGRHGKCRWLIRATVTTAAETLPVAHEGRTLWPVGTFTGWYWDDELEQAITWGASARLHEAYRYLARPALRDWAQWVIDLVEGDGDAYTPLQRWVAKTWARALIGRFGVRYRLWEDWGPGTAPDLSTATVIRASDRKVGKQITMSGRDLVALDDVDGDQTAPAVMSAIMSECRVRLWQLMLIAGHENVAYCDTDSLIVNQRGHDRMLAASVRDGIWRCRVKGRIDSATILGPRQLIVGGGHRFSGVASRAERVSATQWVGERWEGLTHSLEAGTPGSVRVIPTMWEVTGTDRRREHLKDGATGPIRIATDEGVSS